jgi:DNA-binding transcriptional MerR regulator
MPGMMDNVSTVNSVLRTLIALVVLGAVAAAGYLGYTTYHAADIEAKQRFKELEETQVALRGVRDELESARANLAAQAEQIRQKDAEISELNEQVKRLEVAMRLLKMDHRVARLTAVEQTQDDATGESFMLVEFVELNDEGQPIGTPQQFRIRGDVVYIDHWVVKFDDQYVEQADIDRGTSLVLFRRIFGEMQQPIEGFPLDQVGTAPTAYARGGQMSDFEKQIWDDFWTIANDKPRAAALGIRAAHGGAVAMRVQEGKSYLVDLRASDGLSIVPESGETNGHRNGR